MPKLNDDKTPAKVPIKKVAAPPSTASQVLAKREVVYPELQASLFVGEKIITETLAKKILKWETEKEFQARMMAAHKDTTEETWAFKEDYLLKDEEGNKVRCWNVVNNRPFDDTHCRGLAQSLLTRRWADSRNGKGWSINGESIILSLTGRVDSGQHRLIALILACQMQRKNPKRWNLWTEAPSMEGLEEVTQTLDNVKPRTVSDILITSNHFATEIVGGKSVPMSNNSRRECSRMLEKAIDFAWKRTGTGAAYKTQQACLDFLAAHPTIEPMVKHLFTENKNRGISLLRLSPGQMAGVAWLMAGSATDGDSYRNGTPPREKLMDFSRLDLAQDFFVMLSGKAKQVLAVHHAIGGLVGDDSEGLGGRMNEKLAVLSRAWAILAANPKAVITEHDVALKYWDDEEGVKHLLAGEDGYISNFGGVDLGEKVKKTASEDGVTGKGGAEGKAPTPAEVEKGKEDAKNARAAQAQAILDNQAKKKGEAPAMTGKPPAVKLLPTDKILSQPLNKRIGATASGKK